LLALAVVMFFLQAPGLAGSAGGAGGEIPPTVALDGPLAPDQAPRSFRLEPGLRLELVAAEPLIASPVALTFDEHGRLYVAENRGYPTGPGPGEPPAGRIALLEDTDSDGRMDRRTEFASGLTFPNGVMPWKSGLIVTCAPDVLFLRDTDGDGKADERQVLFTGFATSGSTQLRVSHPTLAIDNWIYVTSGLTGGKVVSPTAPDRPAVVLHRTDFRFQPGRGLWEAADGGAQFGLTFDDFGRRFICYNRVQVQHVVIESQTLRRNPHLAFSETVQDCPADLLPEPLKGHGAAARLYPISRNITTADSHAGTFTAACGVTVYRGTGLPPTYRGGAFSCDPTGNLVHFDRLEDRGATFSASPARRGTEFLASSDNWFRPVFLAHGPDGGLYVCDMYRKTIEHPDYLPVEIRKRTDFDSGKTMGRIWRVVREDARPEELRALRRVDLAGKSIPQLCDVLRDLDGWRRDTAHRILLARGDRAAIGPLCAMVEDPQSPPVAVVHALRLLDAQGAIPDDLLRRALRHPAAPVHEHALQLIEPRVAARSTWIAGVLPRADDENARVRFRTAIALGAIDAQTVDRSTESAVAAALARIANRDGSDRWLRAAVFSSLSGRELAFLAALRVLPRTEDRRSREWLGELGRLLGASLPRETWPRLIQAIVEDRRGLTTVERAGLLTGAAEAVRSRLAPAESGNVLAVLCGAGTGSSDGLNSIRELITEMKRIALDPAQPVADRSTAVGLLAFAGFDDVGDALLRLVEPGLPGPLQAAAVRALGRQRDHRVVTSLLAAERFGSYPPSLREEVLSTLIAQFSHLPGLLQALEDGRVPKSAIDAVHRQQLVQHRDADVGRRAAKVFGVVQGDRARVYEAYKEVVTWKADPSKGRAVFLRECASCHRLDQEGHAVGPDLFGIRNQEKPAILLHMLVPDQEITQGFAAYTVATKDGRMLTGLITSETPASITLRQPLGKEDTILRSEIEEIALGKQSLMPQGLEKSISRQDFADLLAYLKGEGSPSGR
jgi:putative membrane-bound dehydrogenase-like protein